MAKKVRVQKKKNKRAKATSSSAFGKMLALAQAEALKKEKLAKAKKLAITYRKIALGTKKKEIEEAEQERLPVQLAKECQK